MALRRELKSCALPFAGLPFFDMYKATVPATCGEEKLVPERELVLPPIAVERMFLDSKKAHKGVETPSVSLEEFNQHEDA